MADIVKQTLRARKEKYRTRIEELRAQKTAINEEIDALQGSISFCERMLSIENINPYDIIPELNDESLGTHL